MQTDDNDQVFSDFLRELKAKEALARDEALSKPIADYLEWAEHFKLAKQQFTGLWALFGKIEETVPNWEREVPYECVGFPYKVLSSELPVLVRNLDNSPSDTRGYCFRAKLCRRVLNGLTDRELGIKLDHIGSEEDLVGYDPIKAELYGLDYVMNKPTFREYYTSQLLASLDKCRLDVCVKADYNERLNKHLKIGFLYKHNLAEVGKQLFVLMNTPGVSDSELEAALPDGDYSRKSIADDNDLFVNRE